MNAKEKANELISRFTDVEDGEMYIGKAKQCALIAVDEILKPSFNGYVKMKSIEKYWEEVKQEIENLNK